MAESSKVEVRKPKMEDLDSLMSVWIEDGIFHNRIDPSYYKKFSDDRTYMENVIKTDNPHIYVAILEGKVVGFVTYELGKADYLDTNISKYGEVLELFVNENFRGHGIGRALLNKVESELKKQGITWVKLQCSTFNPKALKFYEREKYKDRQRLLFKEIK